MIGFFYRVKNSIKSRWYMNVTLPYIRKTLGVCGSNVVIADHSRIAGAENIEIGDDVYIGPETLIYTTKAKLILGNHITIGPRLTIITGDHRTDVVGEYMKSVGDDRKLPEKLISPAIDILKSGTRRDDLLLSSYEMNAVNRVRNAFGSLKPEEAAEKVLDLFTKTRNNEEFVRTIEKIKFF